MSQADPVQPVQKSGSNKTIFIVIAVALILFLCFCCGLFLLMVTLLNPVSRMTTGDDLDNYHNGITENTRDQVEYIDLDETADIDGLEMSILDYDENYVPVDEFEQAEDGMKYIAVELNLENYSQNSIYYSDYNFKVKDTDGYSYQTTSFGTKEPVLGYGTLNIDDTVRGWVTFEVPLEVNEFTLVYSGSFGDKSVEFSLK